MDLDRHRLDEERVWRLDNYRRQVKRTVESLVDAIQQEAKRVIEREVVYDDDQRSEFSFIDQAGQLQHAILQAVNNADFGGLTREAGELHAVEKSRHTLAKMKAQLPEEMRDALERAEDQKQLALLESTVAEREKRDREDAERCCAGVHQGGRGVGFHQCTRKGRKVVLLEGHPGNLGWAIKDDTKGVEARLCATHANEFERRGNVHIFRPSDWDEKQREIYRRKADRQIERIRASLPAQLTEGSGA